MEQQHYVGLDVSLETTSVCVIDHNGAIVWRGKCSTEPEPIRETVRKHAPALVRAGLETGQLSNWLTLELRKLGLPVVCLDARHAKYTAASGTATTQSSEQELDSRLGSCAVAEFSIPWVLAVWGDGNGVDLLEELRSPESPEEPTEGGATRSLAIGSR